MNIDASLVLAGLIVGFVVGLTGMGGGALMTPILVLLLKVQPSTAVASDLMASLVMKPVGATVHARRGTINKPLVGWLCLGSVPTAFGGVLLLRALGSGKDLQDNVKLALGIALLLAAGTMLAKTIVSRRRGLAPPDPNAVIVVRPIPTIVIGAVGGLVVGMTSVGSGSLIIVALLLLYPMLTASRLVGTDLVQAVPLVGAAALGHVLFGDFQLGLTVSLLIGALPAVYLGARVSSRAPDSVIRPALVLVLSVSALKLLDASNELLGLMLLAGGAVWAASVLARRRRARATTLPALEPVTVAAAD